VPPILSKANIEQIFKKFVQASSDPTTELHYKNHFELLIAVMLSAQATDVSVNLATKKLFAAAPTPEAMCDLGIEKIKEFIKTIGLYRTKAKNVFSTSEILLQKYKGKIPKTRQELESLPGVGCKTAAVVLNVAYGANTIPVDTHVFRVSNRLGLVQTKKPEKTEKELLAVIPEWALSRAHHWLILHGRYTCKARKPLCEKCTFTSYCNYFQKEQNAPSK
jgi:endonuclease-3